MGNWAAVMRLTRIQMAFGIGGVPRHAPLAVLVEKDGAPLSNIAEIMTGGEKPTVVLF